MVRSPGASPLLATPLAAAALLYYGTEQRLITGQLRIKPGPPFLPLPDRSVRSASVSSWLLRPLSSYQPACLLPVPGSPAALAASARPPVVQLVAGSSPRTQPCTDSALRPTEVFTRPHRCVIPDVSPLSLTVRSLYRTVVCSRGVLTGSRKEITCLSIHITRMGVNLTARLALTVSLSYQSDHGCRAHQLM